MAVALAVQALTLLSTPSPAAASVPLAQEAKASLPAPGAIVAPPGRAVAFHRIANYSDASFPRPARTARRHRFVVLQSWRLGALRKLQRADPGVKVLMYKNIGFMNDTYAQRGGRRYYASGVSYQSAQRKHPEWILRDRSGRPFRNCHGGCGGWAADVGVRSYQDRWARNVIAELTREPRWDGVYLDDVNSTLRFHHDPADVTGYAPDDGDPETDDDYERAMSSALANVGPKIRALGKVAIGNVCCEAHNESWAEWLPFLSGARDEHFVKYGDNEPSIGTYRGGQGWKMHLGMVEEAELQGKYFLGNTHSTARDVRAMSYGLATLMLASQGRSSFMHGANNADENWFPAYNLAQRIGPSTMVRYLRFESGSAAGVYYRRFLRGLVLVNPLPPVPASTRTVRLDGAYSGSGYDEVTSVTMPGASGLILEKAR